MAEVVIQVTIKGGAGGVAVSIQGQTFSFRQSGRKSLELPPGTYAAGLSGNAPEGGSVTVAILQEGHTLAEDTFTKTTFAGILIFTVSGTQADAPVRVAAAATPPEDSDSATPGASFKAELPF